MSGCLNLIPFNHLHINWLNLRNLKSRSPDFRYSEISKSRIYDVPLYIYFKYKTYFKRNFYFEIIFNWKLFNCFCAAREKNLNVSYSFDFKWSVFHSRFSINVYTFFPYGSSTYLHWILLLNLATMSNIRTLHEK